MESKDKKEELVIKRGKQITKYKVFKKVFSSGGSGAVVLPKSLIGKIVYIEYEEK